MTNNFLVRTGGFAMVAFLGIVLSMIIELPAAALAGTYSWTQATGINGGDQRDWRTVAMSETGARMAAGVYGEYIYTSNDFGANWVRRISSGTRNWYAMDASSDGTKLVAAVYDGYIYTSNNFGATWVEQTGAGYHRWTSVAMSADGTKIAAIGDDIIYTSSDSGTTWTERQTPIFRHWVSLAMSANGAKILVVDSITDAVATSYDSGVTWAEQTMPDGENFFAPAMSSDGTKMIMGTHYGYIYTSADSGVTWEAQVGSGSRYWEYVAVNSDATQMVALDYAGPEWEGGSIYVSSDSGVTWTEQVAPGVGLWWQSVSMNGSGSRILAVAYEGPLYTGAIAGLDTDTFNLSTLTSPVDDIVSKAVLGFSSSTCAAIDTPSLNVLNSDGVTSPEEDVTIVGGIGFSLLCSTPGGSSTATIALGTHHVNLSDIRIYKQASDNSTLLDITSEVNLSNQVLGGNDTTTISYTLIDGSDYDEDGIVNGVIVDPVYFGVASSATLADTGDNHMLILLLGITFLFGSTLTVLVYSSRV